MFIELSNPEFTRDLIAFLRTKDYLAIEERGQIVAVPIQALSKERR